MVVRNASDRSFLFHRAPSELHRPSALVASAQMADFTTWLTQTLDDLGADSEVRVGASTPGKRGH